jgi:uncharacterized protein (DUF1330 family)
MSDRNHDVFLEVSDENGAAFLSRNIKGEVVMLNLLRFREVADYTDHPDLSPDKAISGREAYQKYALHTLPLLEAAGGSLLYAGNGGDFLIGPAGRGWDQVLLVRHKSVQAFMAFASDQDYLAGAGHRSAALLDSRLLPLIDS